MCSFTFTCLTIICLALIMFHPQNRLFSRQDRVEVRRHLQPLSFVEHLSAVVLPSMRRILPAGRQRAGAQPPRHPLLRQAKHQRRQGKKMYQLEVKLHVPIIHSDGGKSLPTVTW